MFFFDPLPGLLEPETTKEAFIGTHFVVEFDLITGAVLLFFFFLLGSNVSTGIVDIGMSAETDFHGDFVGKGAGVKTGCFFLSFCSSCTFSEDEDALGDSTDSFTGEASFDMLGVLSVDIVMWFFG